jgi:signal transduction histidine kinase
LPIRWRLTLFIALVIGAILFLLGLALFLLLRDVLLSNVEDTAENRALSAVENIESGEGLGEEDMEQLTLDGVFVIVRDGSGTVITQTINFPTDEEANDPVWQSAIDSRGAASGTANLSREAPDYVYAVPAIPPNGPAVVVEAGKSYQSAEETIDVVETGLAAGIGVAFLLSIGGAYFLARAALRPVDAVVSAAQEMTEGDLAKRLPVANPKDEIGRLTTTINGLLARLEAAFARREETLSRQRRFAADASHELRTPLTSISGHARMLDEWALENPKMAKRSVGAIRQEARRMRDLVESLLVLTRGDEEAPMEVGRHKLAAVAEEAVETAQASANGKVSVEYVPPGREVEATFERGRVLQVASILLDNAMKYTPEGGRVTVSVEERDGWATLEVSDTGIGIPEDELPLIFERFHRAGSARTEGGAGLGLSIARQIAEAHGGKIEARSVPGEGSTFTLFLPRKGPWTPDEPRTREPEGPEDSR